MFSLKNNEFVRIDKSFNHNMQISSSIFPYNDTIYRYGGYGFWSNRNFFTYFDKSNSEWEVVSPTGSKELPKGSHESIVTIIEDDIFVYGGFRVQEFEPINHTINDEVWKFNTTSKSWKKLGNTDFDLNNQTLKFSYHNKNGFFNILNGELLVVDVLNNKIVNGKKLHEKFGRLLSKIITSEGKDLSDELVRIGLARKYDGGHKDDTPLCPIELT